jgi:membrane protease YdiL (CAAX protease family)
LALTGNQVGWTGSAYWWVFVSIVTNVISISLLVVLLRAEGSRYLDMISFSRQSVGKDLLWFLVVSVIGIPFMAAPMNNLAAFIFGDAMAPINMMFRPMPAWALIVGILFPLTVAFAELPTYFGYVMPRLAVQLKSSWLAWLLASLFLALQHSFLPFIPDPRFFLWRFGLFLPFALFIGLVLKLRPQLLPYCMIVHALMDFATLSVYWMI